METLFGSSGGIPPNSKLKNLDITPDQFKALRGPTAALLGGATSGAQPLSLAGIPSSGMANAAPIGANEQSILAMLMGNLGSNVPGANVNPLLQRIAEGGTALQGAGEQSVLDTLGGKYLGPESNPWLAATVKSAQDQLQFDWENRVMPNLRTSFTGAGQNVTPGASGSSPFDRSMALAASEQGRTLGDVATRVYGENYANERNRQLQALGLGQTATGQQASAIEAGLSGQIAERGQNLADRQAKTAEMIATLETQALPRMIEQMGNDRGTEEFRLRLDALLKLLGVQTSATGVTAANIQPQSSTAGLAPGIVGAAGTVGAAAASAYL